MTFLDWIGIDTSFVSMLMTQNLDSRQARLSK